MSDEPKHPSEENEGQLPKAPERKMQTILQELEVMALRKGGTGNSGLDLSNLSEQQMNSLLSLLEKNEDNAFKFHDKRLDVARDIELKKIESTTINQRTIRIALIIILIAVPAISLLILFFKDQFFIPWLTFLTGILGGLGLSKVPRFLLKQPDSNPIIETGEKDK